MFKAICAAPQRRPFLPKETEDFETEDRRRKPTASSSWLGFAVPVRPWNILFQVLHGQFFHRGGGFQPPCPEYSICLYSICLGNSMPQQAQHAIASLCDDVDDRLISQCWERLAVMDGFEDLAANLADSFSNHRPTEF